MKLNIIRTDSIYHQMINTAPKERDEIYREELMKPFEYKWNCIGIPLRATVKGGYDVVSFTRMGGGYEPSQITEELLPAVEAISDNSFWNACRNSIQSTLEEFESNGIALPIQDYTFMILLNDPNHPMAAMTGDYCGEGGFPGYILGTIIPNENSLKMLPVALAHETNHNVRWQFQTWSPNITLADLIVSEGLAESYVSYRYGEDYVSQWITKTSLDTLKNVVIPMIKPHLMDHDFNKITSYLYGDEIMKMRGGEAIGMPYCGGYACGYHLIQYYLKHKGKSILEATIMDTSDILKDVDGFWNNL